MVPYRITHIIELLPTEFNLASHRLGTSASNVIATMLSHIHTKHYHKLHLRLFDSNTMVRLDSQKDKYIKNESIRIGYS